MALELKKISSTFIQDMDVKSANANYKVQYTIVGENLQSVTAQVYDKKNVDITDPNGEVTGNQEVENMVGNISMSFGTINVNNFPYSEKFPLYMGDFDGIVKEILKP